jgi:cytochrome c553
LAGERFRLSTEHTMTGTSLGCGDLRRTVLSLTLIGVTVSGWSSTAFSIDETVPAISKAERLYGQLCASCHGADGYGVPGKYERPLVGERSSHQLARFVDKRMPKDDPGKLVGKAAKEVADYVFKAFYSPVAQARRRPPRLELSRLTVRQYRNAVADLVGSFRRPAPPPEGRGLHGAYFNAQRPKGKPVAERTDPQLAFSFGRTDPIPDQLEAKGFAARWSGAVTAPKTGTYEIVLRSDQAARVWLNNRRTPLIDAWVQSGDQTEHRAEILLLDGRAYPLRVEFSARHQGVNKDKKITEPLKTFVELRWRPPGDVEQVIPPRHLVPHRTPEVFVAGTAFPPDDRSRGYERGSDVSKAWHVAVTSGAIETAAYITARLARLAGIKESAEKNRDAKEKALREFCVRLVERAFRHPLTGAEKELYVERRFADAPKLEIAVKRVTLLALTSPRFLYLPPSEETTAANSRSYRVAARLSFALWDSLPDAKLVRAAASGELDTTAKVYAHALRLVEDQRVRSKVGGFLRGWLRMKDSAELIKDKAKFPRFDAKMAADLKVSLDLFLDAVIWEEDADFRRLFLSNDVFVNGRLAGYYGFDLPPDAPFTTLNGTQPHRLGVLLHPYVLANLAYHDASSPIHRGVFLLRNVLGRTLQPPPDAFTPFAADLHPALTTRERVTLQTRPDACRSCHDLINPLGFTLEHFDAVGRYRKVEHGKSIDASGSYVLPSGERRDFHSIGDLAEFLANSEQVHQAFTRQLFHYLVKQSILAYGLQTQSRLVASFTRSDFNVRQLVARIATVAALGPVAVDSILDTGEAAAYHSLHRAPLLRRL